MEGGEEGCDVRGHYAIVWPHSAPTAQSSHARKILTQSIPRPARNSLHIGSHSDRKVEFIISFQQDKDEALAWLAVSLCALESFLFLLPSYESLFFFSLCLSSLFFFADFLCLSAFRLRPQTLYKNYFS